jgi:hypothetical protein
LIEFKVDQGTIAVDIDESRAAAGDGHVRVIYFDRLAIAQLDDEGSEGLSVLQLDDFFFHLLRAHRRLLFARRRLHSISRLRGRSTNFPLAAESEFACNDGVPGQVSAWVRPVRIAPHCPLRELAMSAAKIRFVDELTHRNRQSRELWDEYACHRRHVMELVVDAAADQPRPRRLCALGAGNCNDLDLLHLLRDYDEIHLVDVDAAAVEAGVARQRASGPRLRIHGRMDVTGCLHALVRDLSANGIENGQIDGWIEKIRMLPAFPQPSPFCVVVSLGLVTQLAETAYSLVGSDHPRGNDLVFALRNHHLRKILEMTRPGGIAILVTDVVSSATFPGLPTLDERILPREMYRQVAAKNFFTGANPYALEVMFRNDADLASRVSEVEMLDPWRWKQGPRTLLVSGLRLRTND